jgi:hypothetical protein
MPDETIDTATVTLPLSNGGTTLIDGDLAFLQGHTWWRNREGYAVRHTKLEGRHRTILLSRLILGLELGDKRQADHINRHRLDNRRSNLRVVTDGENKQNVGARLSPSKYRGVCWDRTRKQWLASTKLRGVKHHHGRFALEINAARAAEAFRRTHMPLAVPDLSLDPVGRCPCRGCRPPAITFRDSRRHADV